MEQKKQHKLSITLNFLFGQKLCPWFQQHLSEALTPNVRLVAKWRNSEGSLGMGGFSRLCVAFFFVW